MKRRPSLPVCAKPPPVCENCGAPYEGKGAVRICPACPPLIATDQDKELSESQIQKQMIALLIRAFPQVLPAHVPNGQLLSGLVRKQLGSRSGAEVMGKVASFQRSMGLVPGWPDLLLACPGGRMLFVEVKSCTGELSDEQIEVHRELRARRFAVRVCRTVNDLQSCPPISSRLHRESPPLRQVPERFVDNARSLESLH